MDVVQLFIYLGGTLVSTLLILHRLPNGWTDVVQFATADGMNKFEIFNLHWGNGLLDFFSSPYTLLGGLVGGTFLTMASHGTDQLLVQRLLGCASKRDSQRALMLDATFIVIQFAFFLILGLCLFAFYHGIGLQQLELNHPMKFSRSLSLKPADRTCRNSYCRCARFGNGKFVLFHQLACFCDVSRSF